MGFEFLKSERPDLWDRFTRREEYENPIRDMYGRFPYWASRERDIFRPSVSEYLFEQGLVNPEYPDGCEFAVWVTHDIDIIYGSPYTKLIAGCLAIKQGDTKTAKQEILSLHTKKKPYFNFDEILSLEEKYGVKSTWFFQALNPGEPEFRYFLSDIECVFGDILEAGGEIGLHGGFEAPYNLDKLLLEKSRLEKILGQKVAGYRNHFLKFQMPDTLELLAQAGFSYDSTLGYADCIGFRTGMCHPYKPVNLNTGKEINIIELPLHIMEGSMFHHYMRLNFDMGWKLVQQIIERVQGCQGILVINWHNTSYREWSVERKLLEKILGYCQEKDAWMRTNIDAHQK
ncbi:conserved hypothetical protein [Methanospirillum hungatei JF-1]|uniref:Polysaccharide deacetylase n=1 Tax=Methanospirillum hungatei JF-1 (strain ATCC 27890 / DSM 864 / NBRC 100397 / JF-1) TaxID=323259 RepID=Q2FN23_METHJ|nr:polysaccharide deacetylase family protein [Methanospirillum hungatei]ABD40148.1 conserved hypothetical protein [Methanospirillum hungatei JF-1]